MGKIIRAQIVLVLAVVGSGVAYFEAPYVRLKTENLCGRLDYRALPVGAFNGAPIDEPVRVVALGRLQFSVPIRALVRYEDAETTSLEFDGLQIRAFAPLLDGVPHYKDLLDEGFPHAGGFDAVSLIAAAYAADSRNLSLWSHRDADALRQLLQVRAAFLPFADYVETLRAPSIKGVVAIGTFENGHIAFLFDFYSPQEDVSGTITFMLESASDARMKLARAIIGSAQLS